MWKRADDIQSTQDRMGLGGCLGVKDVRVSLYAHTEADKIETEIALPIKLLFYDGISVQC
jgi:hypothetical protein